MKISTNRLAAFSDGVFAIIITIIVLGVSFPNTFNAGHIRPFLWEIFIFFESSLTIGGFWHGHSKLFDGYDNVSDTGVFFNMLLLIVLALVPIFTSGIMKHPDETFPTVGFGIVFLLSNILFNILSAIMQDNKENDKRPVQPAFITIMALMKYKGNTKRLRIIQPAFITVITLIAFWSPRTSSVLFVLLPVSWWVITFLSGKKDRGVTSSE